jgi:hypothetical protein
MAVKTPPAALVAVLVAMQRGDTLQAATSGEVHVGTDRVKPTTMKSLLDDQLVEVDDAGDDVTSYKLTKSGRTAAEAAIQAEMDAAGGDHAPDPAPAAAAPAPKAGSKSGSKSAAKSAAAPKAPAKEKDARETTDGRVPVIVNNGGRRKTKHREVTITSTDGSGVKHGTIRLGHGEVKVHLPKGADTWLADDLPAEGAAPPKAAGKSGSKTAAPAAATAPQPVPKPAPKAKAGRGKRK